MQTKGFSKVAMGVFGALTLVGIACWIFQLIGGLGVTGMSNTTSWGLYICMFMLFVGLSAGGLIVASSAHVFGIEKFKPIAKPAVIMSTVCICVAGMLILVDLGGIQRIWRLVTGPNFMSPLLWDVCIITIYLVINILDLVWMQKGENDKVRKLSYVALPVAILVHSVTAWIFGLQIARAWYTAIMAPIFVASALDSGLALLLLGLLLIDKVGIAELGDELLASLAKLLATFIAVDAFFIGCELLTMAYPGAGEAAALSHMLSGATAPFFWFEIIGGLLVPFVILAIANNRTKRGMVVLASALVVLGVACKRIWLLFTSFITPNVAGAPGIAGGSAAAREGGDIWAIIGTYAPTLPEILIVVGVISLGVLAFMVLCNKLVAGEEVEQQVSLPSEEVAQAA
ncbi:MAG: polysulfide reductase NrfD [Eggerthellaceae bacterium]|nr:polysulfide reductase NrfD [Eggerthellaceae bacterium]